MMRLLPLNYKRRRITTLNSTTSNDNKVIKTDTRIANDLMEFIPHKLSLNNSTLLYGTIRNEIVHISHVLTYFNKKCKNTAT